MRIPLFLPVWINLAVVVLFAVLVVPARAEDQLLEASVKLPTAKKVSGRSEGPAEEVPLAIWIPADVKTVRGAVFNPFYTKAVSQQHWQAACRHWQFCIVAGNYFGVRKPDFAPSLLEGLKQFAERSGHPEIAHLPLCPVGMSAGAGMSLHFAAQMPERILAAGPVCLEVGPDSDATRQIPILTIFGERDGKQMEKLLAKLPVQRAAGAQWAIAPQWGRRHEFARANNLLMPLFERAILARYPEEASPLHGRVELRTLDLQDGWLGDPESWQTASATIAPVGEYQGDKSKACWLADRYLAHCWQAFVAPRGPLQIVAPKGQGDGDAFRVHPAESPLVVELRVADDAGFDRLELFDGDRRLGRWGDPSTPLKVERPRPGIYALIAVGTRGDGRRVVSPLVTVLVGR